MNNQILVDPTHRLNVLEQKLTVMQSELSEVLGEMQKTIQALAKMTQVGMRVVNDRLDALEKCNTESSNQRSNDTGKEL